MDWNNFKVFKEFYPQGKAEKFSASIFNVFDTDHSGKIDFTGKKQKDF